MCWLLMSGPCIQCVNYLPYQCIWDRLSCKVCYSVIQTHHALNVALVHVCVLCRMKTAEKQYIEAFEDELKSFLLRVRQRAQVRIETAMKEAEEVGNHLSLLNVMGL